MFLVKEAGGRHWTLAGQKPEFNSAHSVLIIGNLKCQTHVPLSYLTPHSVSILSAVGSTGGVDVTLKLKTVAETDMSTPVGW